MFSRIRALVRRYKAVSGVLSILLVAGVSYAAWSVMQNNGSSKGKIGQLQAPTVDDTAAFTGVELLPGGNGDLVAHVSNPNSRPLTLTSVNAGTAAISGLTGACDTASASGTGVNVTGNNSLSIPIPPGASDVTVPNAVSLDTNAPSTCQGQSFSVVGLKFNFGS